MTRCYNTEAADQWSQEQDDNEAKQERKREKLHLLLDEKSELIAEFLRDKFAAVISDDNNEDGHAALERIFLRAFFEDSTDNDCEFLMSESELIDKLGSELDD